MTYPGMPDDTLPSAGQNASTDRDVIWVMDSGGPKEPCVTRGHIDATWQIRLKYPCAAAMRPYVKLL